MAQKYASITDNDMAETKTDTINEFSNSKVAKKHKRYISTGRKKRKNIKDKVCLAK